MKIKSGSRRKKAETGRKQEGRQGEKIRIPEGVIVSDARC